MSANVVHLRPAQTHAAADALAALDRQLGRSKLKPHTVRAYHRQAATYVDWLADNAGLHPDAFADKVGAEAAVSAWLRSLLLARQKPASLNQALAAVALMYETATHIGLEIDRARVPKPGAPDALTDNQRNAVQRAADRLSPRDAAIIAVLLGSGARVEECARLRVSDVALSARTGEITLIGKGDQTRTNDLPAYTRDRLRVWLKVRAEKIGDKPDPGDMWLGQRGPMTVAGITKVVLAVGAKADIPGLRPHRLRHTYATRLRRSGADPAVIQAAMGHASIETTQRYFRASRDEVREAIERAFEN